MEEGLRRANGQRALSRRSLGVHTEMTLGPEDPFLGPAAPVPSRVWAATVLNTPQVLRGFLSDRPGTSPLRPQVREVPKALGPRLT